jgi:opacity protein-like surface antigen
VAVDVSGGFGVYAGGGIGATLTRAELLLDVGGGTMLAFPADEDVTLSWQVTGGVQYAFNERLLVYGGVTYFTAGDSEFASFVSENSSLAVVLGLRVYF